MSLSRRLYSNVEPGRPARQQLRKALLSWRESMPSDQNHALTQRIGQHLVLMLAQHLESAAINSTSGKQQPLCIGVFWPIRGEPDLQKYYQDLTDLGFILALPFIKTPLNTSQSNRYLTYAKWATGQPTVTGKFAIEQPASITEVIPDLILAPCVGFDKNGYRLGYGAGYFDQTLKIRPTNTFGIAFAPTEVDDLHPSPSDVRLNAILTESGVHYFSD